MTYAKLHKLTYRWHPNHIKLVITKLTHTYDNYQHVHSANTCIHPNLKFNKIIK